MKNKIQAELAKLEKLTTKQLREKYYALFNEETRSNNRPYLIRRLAWRLQAGTVGGISGRARERARVLAEDAPVRLQAPKNMPKVNDAERTQVVPVKFSQDTRLPAAGTIITRDYKGQKLQVRVLPDGFEFQGEIYRSLSAVAKSITGSHCNGFLFFKLGEYGDKA